MPTANLKLRIRCATALAHNAGRMVPRNRMILRRELVNERRLTKRELREMIEREAWACPATTE